MVAEVRAIHKNDQGPILIESDEQRRNTATIPSSIRNGDEGYIPMGNRTKCDHGNDQNG